MTKISVVTYGVEVVCMSCANASVSMDAYQWLQALLLRKFPQHHFEFTYIDIRNDTGNLTDHDMQLIERISKDKLFYPLVTVNDEYVADGYI